MADRLVVRGAREHNLRGVDLDIPRDSLVVFTGLSGSGKSSLAFDTIFAEGQRRYVESLSAYARQFLGQMDKPDVDFIEGLSPAVSIDQKSTNRNPRSTVGTITEVYDYLRLLYARAGVPHCPVCGHVIEKQTPQQIVDQVLAMEEGARFQVLAPVVRTRKGEFVDLFANLQGQGYSRVLVDGTVHQLTDPPKLKKQEKHDISVVVDRLTVKASAKQRLTDSVETALRLADGLVVLEFVDLPDDHQHRERRFSERMACPNGHPLTLDDLEPRTFSFNSPYGACPECAGLGIKKEVDPELVVPDVELSLADGAIAPWAVGHAAEYFGRLLEGLANAMGFRMATPWRRLPSDAQKAVLHGSDDQVHVRYRNRYGRERSYYANFEGVIPFLERRLDQTESDCAARAVRGLHARRAVPGLQGRAAQARGPRGHARCTATRASGRSPRSRRCRWPSASEFLAGMELDARQTDDRGRDPQGGAGPAGVPARRRAALPVAVPRRRDALRRRGAAHPAGHPDRLRPGRRALRARRAVHRAAPARQPQAHPDARPAARPGQHADRRRARRGHDPRRPTGPSTSGPARASTAARSCTAAPSRGSRRIRSRSPAPTCPGGGRSRCPTSAGRSTASGS